MPYDKPVIGILLSKDDGDIINDVMTEYNKYFDAIYCIDASSDNSLDIIKSFDKVKYAVSEKELGINGAMLKDGIRQLLLSKVQDDFGYDGWIFPIQTDEMYVGNIRNILPYADNQNANVINCLIAHFIMHKTDTETADKPNIVDRKLWYFMGQCENAAFKNKRGLYYNFFEHMRVLPHEIRPFLVCNRVLIRRHYNQRTEEQLRARIKNRLDTGWQPAYKALENNLYITDPNQMITCGAIYSPIQKFDGTFRFSHEHSGWISKIIS